jgi:hypothetical protein
MHPSEVGHFRFRVAAAASALAIVACLAACGIAEDAFYEPIPSGRYQAYLNPVEDTCGAGSSVSTYEVSARRGIYSVTSRNTEVSRRTTDHILVFTGKATEGAVQLTMSSTRRIGDCDAPTTGLMTLRPTADGFEGEVEIRADICGRPCASLNSIQASRTQ